MAEDSIIIDVDIQGVNKKLQEVTIQINKTKDATAELKAQNKELSKDFATNSAAITENNLKIAQNNEEVKTLTTTEKALQRQLTDTTKSNEVLGTSFKEQGKKLTTLKNDYRSLSEEQRNSEGGQKMLKDIQELDAAMKANDKTLGDHQRNVGNYPKILDLSGTSFGKLKGIVQNLGQQTASTGSMMGNAFGSIKTQAISMGKAFLTPPIGIIVAVLAGIMWAVQKVSDAFAKNDDATTKLEVAFASFQPILTLVSQGFDKLALGIANVVEWLGNAVVGVTAFAEKLGLISEGYTENVIAAQEFVKAQDALQDMERDYIVSKEENEARIAELRNEALEKDKYSAAEKKSMLAEAKRLEEENFEAEKKITDERLRLKRIELEQLVDTSDAAKDQLAKLEAEQLRTSTNYYNGLKRLQQQYNSAAAELDKEEEDRRKAVDESRKKRAKTTADALEQYERALRNAIADEVEREVANKEAATAKEIENIKNRLANESDLTVEARKALNDTITLLSEQSALEVATIREKASQEAFDKEVALENKRQAELLAGTRATLAEQALLLQNDFNEKKNAIFGREKEIAELELQFQRKKNEQLLNLDQEQKDALYSSEAEYQAAVITSLEAVAQAERDLAKVRQKVIEDFKKNTETLSGAIEDVFSELAGDTKAFAVFQKAIALANASLNLASAISAATIAATQGGDPYTIAARVAAAVGGVIVAFSQVTKSINSATIPDEPAFADGGVVQGSSAAQGDSVRAWLTPDELVLNGRQQARMLYALANSNLPQGGNNIEALTAAFTAAAKAIPPNVLDYQEYNTFKNNVITYNEHASI